MVRSTHPLVYSEAEMNTHDEDEDAIDHSAWLMIENDDKPRRVLGEKDLSRLSTAAPEQLHRNGGRKRPARLSLSTTTQRTASGSSSGSSTASSALSTPTSPRPLDWIGGLFKGKPASYQLLSTRDSLATRDECRRILQGMGINVLLCPSPGEAIGLLGCTVPDNGIAGLGEGAGSVFRVEIRRPTSTQFSVGYAVAAHLVREKGSLAAFKTVYNALRRAWEYDAPVSIFSHTTGGSTRKEVGPTAPQGSLKVWFG
jgi:hypothetical protein